MTTIIDRTKKKVSAVDITVRQRNNKLFIAYLSKNVHEEYTFKDIESASKEFERLTNKRV